MLLFALDFPSCGTKQFRCNNSQCIESQLRCDSKEDCMDASDEENCGKD